MPNPLPFIKSLTGLVQQAPKSALGGAARNIVPEVAEEFAGSRAGFFRLERLLLDGLPPLEPGYKRLYRVASQTPQSSPGVDINPDIPHLRGRWFTDSPDTTQWYLEARPNARMAYIDLPKEVADGFNVYVNPETRGLAQSKQFGGREFLTDITEYVLPLPLPGELKSVRLRPDPMPTPRPRRPFLNQ